MLEVAEDRSHKEEENSTSILYHSIQSSGAIDTSGVFCGS